MHNIRACRNLKACWKLNKVSLYWPDLMLWSSLISFKIQYKYKVIRSNLRWLSCQSYCLSILLTWLTKGPRLVEPITRIRSALFDIKMWCFVKLLLMMMQPPNFFSSHHSSSLVTIFIKAMPGFLECGEGR